MGSLEYMDEQAYDAIVARLERVEDGNFGDCGPVGGGVSELRFIKTGPGYRVYFGEHDDLVIILGGGTKKTQKADIDRAKELWSTYKNG
jgi:putative addiction module killer protein